MSRYVSSNEFKRVIFLEYLDEDMTDEQLSIAKEVIEKVFKESAVYYNYKQAKLGLGRRKIRLEFKVKGNHSDYAYTMLKTMFSSKIKKALPEWMFLGAFTDLGHAGLNGSIVENLVLAFETPKVVKDIEPLFNKVSLYRGQSPVAVVRRLEQMGFLECIGTQKGRGSPKIYKRTKQSLYLSEEYLI
jgi:hypothetical protein